MDSGRWGCSMPIKNYRWNRMGSQTGTISSVSGNEVQFTTPGVVIHRSNSIFGVNGAQQFGKLGKAILGPSTHSSNLEANEHLFVEIGSSSSPKNLFYQQPSSMSFNVGDTLTMTGAGPIPYGWAWANASSGSLLATIDECYSADPFTLVLKSTTVGTTLYTKLPQTHWNKFVRISMMMRILDTYTPNSTFQVGLTGGDAVGTFLTGCAITINSVQSNQWYEWSVESALPANADPEDLYIYLTLGSADASAARICIAGIAVSTTDQYNSTYSTNSYNATSGVLYTFSSVPNLGGVRVRRVVDGSKISKTMANRPTMGVVMNRGSLPLPRYEVSYDIEEVTATEWDNIQLLLGWQQRGGLINHFPHTEIKGLPYYMTGTIDISSRLHRITDLSKQGFRLTFTEASL